MTKKELKNAIKYVQDKIPFDFVLRFMFLPVAMVTLAWIGWFKTSTNLLIQISALFLAPAIGLNFMRLATALDKKNGVSQTLSMNFNDSFIVFKRSYFTYSLQLLAYQIIWLLVPLYGIARVGLGYAATDAIATDHANAHKKLVTNDIVNQSLLVMNGKWLQLLRCLLPIFFQIFGVAILNALVVIAFELKGLQAAALHLVFGIWFAQLTYQLLVTRSMFGKLAYDHYKEEINVTDNKN